MARYLQLKFVDSSVLPGRLLLRDSISHHLCNIALCLATHPSPVAYVMGKEFEALFHRRAWTGQERRASLRCEGLRVMDFRR